MLRATALLAAAAAVSAQDHGSCGFQCGADQDCAGCGADGSSRCSSPASATKYPSIGATCVSAPSGAPTSPAANVTDSMWPMQWTADVEAWCYSDFSDNHSVAKGRFYYDATLGRTRGDWHPYINGKAAKQVWLANTGSAKSNYYVVSGALCIYFPISDPGDKAHTSIERHDWMARCDKAGFAKYMGREQVAGEWADHYACVLDYAEVNQTIAFQNWHSLGLGKTPKGLPMRVTGGNSAPNAQQGSPRLNTVWYTNFTTGPNATSAADFEKPSGLCIPVAAEDAAAHFGVHAVSTAQTRDPAFRARAHWLPHTTPSAADLARAARAVPRGELVGRSLQDAMVRLNARLATDTALATRECAAFNATALHAVQRLLFSARTAKLQQMLRPTDNRRLPYSSDAELAAVQRGQREALRARPDLHDVVRDGLCHEAVMQYIHHLSAAARAELRSGDFVLPLLPEHEQHPAPPAGDAAASAAHTRYTAQVSCAICHVE